KGKQEAGVNVIDYVEHHRDLLGKYHALCEKHNLEGSLLPMLQEYIKGYGCGFFALYDHGKCCVTFQHRRIREMPPSGGRSVAAETGFNPLVAEYGKQILDALQWHGLAMVEFKVDESGRPFLMEINAKLWGSIELAISAGVNFPQMMVDLHLGKQPAIDVCRKSKLRYTWPFNGDIMYGMLRPKAMCGVIKDTLCLRVKNNCQLSDIRPTIKMAGHFAKTFVKYCVHGQYES
ncbi:MAG TPA: ATP-grasp domain-containing protein, partial [bacterium]|nr:ATP-grasp domain-containing protein [bacterium]